MAGIKKPLLIAAAILVLVLTLGVLALNYEYDSPQLGRVLLDRVGRSGDVALQAEGFRLSPLRGFTLTSVTATTQLPAGPLHFTADRVVLKHQLGPLLRGEVLVEEIVLERPQVELRGRTSDLSGPATSKPSPRAAVPSPKPEASQDAGGEAEASGGPHLTLRVSRIAILDGSLTLHPEPGVDGTTAAATEIHGLDLELRDLSLNTAATSPITALQAVGELTADQIVADPLRAKDVQGTLRIREGHIQITDLALPAAEGKLTVSELDLDLTGEIYNYQLALAGDPLNTNLIMGAAAEGGFGPGHLRLALTGDGSESGNLNGQGTLTFTPGTIPGFPVVSSLEALLAGTSIVGSAYEPFSVSFHIANERLEIEPFEVVCGELRFGFGGAIGLDDTLHLPTSLRAPRQVFEGIKEIPAEVLEAFIDEEGQVQIPILIAGTSLAPQAGFDKKAWGRMVGKRVQNEVEKELGRQLEKGLGKLFGKSEN